MSSLAARIYAQHLTLLSSRPRRVGSQVLGDQDDSSPGGL